MYAARFASPPLISFAICIPPCVMMRARGGDVPNPETPSVSAHDNK